MKHCYVLTILFCLVFTIEGRTQSIIKISGKVTEYGTNEPLQATITVKGTAITAYSDGFYSIEIPKTIKNATLQCILAGYETVEVIVGDRNYIEFELHAERYWELIPFIDYPKKRYINIYGNTPRTHFGIGYSTEHTSPFWSSWLPFDVGKMNIGASYHTDFSDNMEVKANVENSRFRASFNRYYIPELSINMNSYLAMVKKSLLKNLNISLGAQLTDFRYDDQKADWALLIESNYYLPRIFKQTSINLIAGAGYWFDSKLQYYAGFSFQCWRLYSTNTFGSWMGKLYVSTNLGYNNLLRRLSPSIGYERFLNYENLSLKLAVRFSTE